MTASMKDGRVAWLDGLATGEVVGLYRGEHWREGLPLVRKATVRRTPSGRLYLDGGRMDWAAGTRLVPGEGRLVIGPVTAMVKVPEGATVRAGQLVTVASKEPHTCGNCEGVQPESCLFNQPAGKPASVDATCGDKGDES